MNFKEEDIEPLDTIVSLLLTHGTVSMDTLFEKEILSDDNINGFDIDLINTPKNKYERYLSILKSRNLCSVTSTKDGKYAQKTEWTYGFLTDGGFKEEFKKLSEKERPTISNDFSGSTIGQVNQSSEKMDLKGTFKQNNFHDNSKESKKKSWIKILAWIVGIIAGLIAIYEFLLKNL